MTAVAWIAVLGPFGGVAVGILVGFFMGKASNADEIGEQRERVDGLAAQLKATRAQLEAATAAPPSRRESARVLDLVSPPGAA